MQDRYITITVAKRNIDEARTYFSRVGTDLDVYKRQHKVSDGRRSKYLHEANICKVL